MNGSYTTIRDFVEGTKLNEQKKVTVKQEKDNSQQKKGSGKGKAERKLRELEQGKGGEAQMARASNGFLANRAAGYLTEEEKRRLDAEVVGSPITLSPRNIGRTTCVAMLSIVTPELSILTCSFTGSSLMVTSSTSWFTINCVLPLSAIVASDVV